MIRRTAPLLVLTVVVGWLAACSSFLSMSAVKSQTAKKKLAIASLSVNDYAGTLQGWNKANTSNLLVERMNDMLAKAEARFGAEWDVISAPQFAAAPEYQALAGYPAQVVLPAPGGASMPVLASSRKELVKCAVDASKIQQFARLTGADVVAVIYSEWTVATGSFVPTSKPLTKTVLGLFDASGKKIYHGRKDVQGDRTLGAFGKTVVDEDTINDWIVAFDRGLSTLLAG